MKKLIAVVALFFAFTVSANAQDKKNVDSSEAAKKDVAALIEKITITENLKKDFYTMMVMKHDELAQAKTKAEKDNISTFYERKVMGGLDKEQRQTLTNNPALLKQLTH